jgi:hypothetical protein
MKWGQRFDNEDEVPEELRGKSPAEVAAALKKAKELEAQAVAAEAARVAAAAEAETHKTELQKAQERITALEANQKPVEPPPPDEPPSPWADPEKFVDGRMAGLTAVALSSGMMTAKMYFMQQLSPRDAKIFRKYEKDVETGVNTFAPAQRVMPQSWFNMFMFVKGQHEQDIQKAESDKSDFFSETPSRGEHHTEPPEDKLTPEEEEVCNKFHYDKKQYLERKKTAALSQSSKGAYARYPVPTTK